VDPIEHDRRVYEYGEDKSQFVVLPLLGFSRSNQIRGYIKDIVEMLLKE
jgi:hypothetical protein